MEKEVLLEVKDLDITYGESKKKYKAVKKVNFKIYKGETFGLVGGRGNFPHQPHQQHGRRGQHNDSKVNWIHKNGLLFSKIRRILSLFSAFFAVLPVPTDSP